MDKVFASAEDAVADLADGATIAIAGFGVAHRFPSSLLKAVRANGARNLTLVANSLGTRGDIGGLMLVENHQASHIVVSISARPGIRTAAENQIAAGELTYELVPQGTLVDRCRAGGAGIPAFYTPTGVGTPIADGKEVRYFGGKPHILEEAIHVDYALLKAQRADRLGNLQFRGGSQNLNPSFAKAARVAIAEAEEIVEIGEIPPHEVDLPGIFVSRVVKSTSHVTAAEWQASRAPRRAAEVARSYNGKPGLTRGQIAQRTAQLIPDGSVVNLGSGIPTLVGNYLNGRDVLLHAENGILGYGGSVSQDEIDPDLYNASGEFISIVPGASFFDSVTSFEMARGGRLAAVVLGAFQVDQAGNLANYATPELIGGGVGGAMDLVAGGSTLIITMEHRDSHDHSKLMRSCSYPLTGVACVDVVVTDLALLRRTDGQFVLEEIAPGFSVAEVLALTDMDVKVPASVGTMLAAAVA
jgi:3-oxoacid CoA-transferase